MTLFNRIITLAKKGIMSSFGRRKAQSNLKPAGKRFNWNPAVKKPSSLNTNW